MSDAPFVSGLIADIGASAVHPDGLTNEQVAAIVKAEEESK